MKVYISASFTSAFFFFLFYKHNTMSSLFNGNTTPYTPSEDLTLRITSHTSTPQHNTGGYLITEDQLAQADLESCTAATTAGPASNPVEPATKRPKGH